MDAPGKRANRGLAARLALMAAGSFAFGFALVPLYDVFCEVTGIGTRAGLSRAAVAGAISPDMSRTVVVEFTASVPGGGHFAFAPVAASMEVHPGRLYEARFLARNLAGHDTIGQAVPSVAPGVTAAHFKKIECFCFSRQTLLPGEAREMPVRFVVDPALDKNVQTITLSYTFFNTDKAQAKRYGGEALAQSGHDALTGEVVQKISQ